MDQRKKIAWRIALVLVAVVAAVFAGVRWRALRALQETGSDLASQNNFRFTIQPYTAPTDDRFAWISSPAVFHRASFFHGHLYVSGPTGLFEYDGNGSQTRVFHAGQQLPASPLVSQAVGTLADAHTPELLLATAREGVLAFDGSDFRHIRPVDAQAREITSLLPTSSGRLLLGTERKGVLIYDGKRISPLHANLAGLHVTELAGDDTDLWVGTHDRGVLHWHGGQVDSFAEEQGLPDVQVQAITLAGDYAFVGTALGVAEFQAGRFVRVLARNMFARSLLVRGGSLLIGTWNDGVVEVALEARRPGVSQILQSTDSGPNEVEQIFAGVEPDAGSIFALTHQGLYRSGKKGLGWKKLIAGESGLLADGNISAISVDAAGRLWVGYFDRGLDLIAADGKKIKHTEDERVFCVNRIVSDVRRNSTTVATANGLVMFDTAGNIQQVLTRADGLIADHVTDVALQSDGSMVLATPAGLTFLDASGPHSLYAFHGLVNNHVYALGSNGKTLLAGTLGGISLLDGDQVRANFTTASSSGLKHNWITAIVLVGDEWMVGTYGAGVLRMDRQGRFELMDLASEKFEVNPNAMLVTPDHVLAGSLGRGLYIYDRKSERWSVLTSGLPSGNVTALAAGGGHIYVGTDNGLVRIAERDLNR